MLKRALVFWIFLMLSLGTATGAAADEKPFIFGLLLVGPYNDHGWSQTHYEGGDRVSVLHLGRVIESMVRPFDTDEILKMMFGARPHTPMRSAQPAGSEMLVMQRVSSSGGRCGLVDCSVVIREGEVVGLAGLEGGGQEVFLRLACGLKRPQKGAVRFCGRTIIDNKYSYFKVLGVYFLPAARLEEGLIPGLTITEHLALQDERRPFRVGYHEATEAAASRIANFRIKGLPQTSVEELSGGNQQANS
jgi:simple sugar transport system ATP-binding protein